MGNSGAAITAEDCANDAMDVRRHSGRSRAAGYAEGPRPGRHGMADWAPTLAMVGAGVMIVLYIMTTINASTADKLTGVTRSIEELDKRRNIRFDEMDRRYDVRFGAMEQRLERLELRADRTDERLGKVETRLTGIDAKLDRVLEHVAKRR
jgi:hypothetical protein